MSFLIMNPADLTAAIDDLQTIGSTLAATNTAAAAPTTSVLPPATDSVSARAAALLDAHAHQYQALSVRAEAFQNQFVQNLVAAKEAYTEAEASNAAAMQLNSAASTSTSSSPQNIALVMGGTGNPTPNSAYLASIEQTYLAQNYPGYTPVSLTTPEQFWPITGLTSESFNRSVQQGLVILNTQVIADTSAGDHVVVVGYSQSATIATLEMRALDALPAGVRPSPNLLSFVLLADPNNPVNGGILTHWIPGFGQFHVPTPLDTPYTTAIYTLQYDAIANFPRSIWWLPSDLNALFGFFDLHHTYPFLTPAQVAGAIAQQFGNTTYYFMPATNLPLLDPIRWLPFIGNPLANLLQPFLAPIVDFGYGDTFLMPGLSPLAAAGVLGSGPAIATPLFAGLPPTGLPTLTSPL